MNEERNKFNAGDWVLIISGLFFADVLQIGLNLFFGIGGLANRILSPLIGATFILYGFVRGVNVLNAKKLANVAVCTGMETIGVGVDVLPTFTLMGVIAMFIENSETLSAPAERAGQTETAPKQQKDGVDQSALPQS